jgi:hypothetical protein
MKIFNELRILLHSTVVANSEHVEEREFKNHEIGLLLDWIASRHLSLETGIEYDLIQSYLSRALVRGSWDVHRYSLYAEYLYREPRIDKYSFFEIFKPYVDPYSQVRTGGFFPLTKDIHPGIDGVVTLFEGEADYAIDLHVTGWNIATLGYRFAEGSGGEEKGLFGSFSVPISKALQAEAGMDIFRYSHANAPSAYRNENSYSSFVSLRFTPVRAFRFSAEVQYLEDKNLKNIVRGVLNADYTFFKGF